METQPWRWTRHVQMLAATLGFATVAAACGGGARSAATSARTTITSRPAVAGSETPAVTPRQSAGALSRSFVRCFKPDMVLAFDASPWI